VPLVDVLRVPLSEDLSGFLALLQHLRVPCRVSEEADEQVLRVPADVAFRVLELYQHYPQGAALGVLPEQSAQPSNKKVGGRFWAVLKRNPLTLLVLLLTLLVAVVTQLGDDLAAVRSLSFLDFRLRGEYAYFASLEQTLAEGQWWRLVTPIFVHFGLLHLVMNGLWFWELGRRIEVFQGAVLLIALTLGFGMISNVAQYVYGAPGIFGGLSGVLYGLLGHCWLYQRLRPVPAYALPAGVLGLMLIWLLVCLSGLVETLSFGAMAIANASHVSGLLAGCLTGSLSALWARRRSA